jgi:hypothetical protein
MGTPLLPITYLFGDKRSYLYPGKSKNELTAEERQLEAMYDKIDRPGNRITPQQFFQSPEYAQYLDGRYGSILDTVPPGSQIISSTPFKVEYRDAEGYTHVLTRKPDSSGQVTQTTSRPAILPNKENEATMAALRARVEKGLNAGPAGLAQLDPETAAALKAISDAERGRIDQGINDQQGQLIAQLYGNRVNQSSIANEAGARFAEGAGRVRQQQSADAASRELAIRNLLTTIAEQANQFQTGTAANLLGNLTGQGTQRDIAGAGIDLSKLQLGEQSRQFNLSNYLDQLRSQLERDAFEESRSPLNQFSKLLGIGQQVAGAASGGLSAYRALTGGR